MMILEEAPTCSWTLFYSALFKQHPSLTTIRAVLLQNHKIFTLRWSQCFQSPNHIGQCRYLSFLCKRSLYVDWTCKKYFILGKSAIKINHAQPPPNLREVIRSCMMKKKVEFVQLQINCKLNLRLNLRCFVIHYSLLKVWSKPFVWRYCCYKNLTSVQCLMVVFLKGSMQFFFFPCKLFSCTFLHTITLIYGTRYYLSYFMTFLISFFFFTYCAWYLWLF